jgi:DNA-binding IclR family transcriptional regulator
MVMKFDEDQIHGKSAIWLFSLVQRDRVSLQEVADAVEVTKSTAHHHLATLRTAGLVRVSDADKGYSLRKEMLPNVWKVLQEYLQLEIDPIA